MIPNYKEFKYVCDELNKGSELSLAHLVRIFGNDVYEIIIKQKEKIVKEKWIVYGIAPDVDHGIIRYIGITQHPSTRLSQHKKNKIGELGKWINSIEGKIRMIILHEVDTEQKAKEIELFTIRMHINWNHSLYNIMK